ncbi:MAG: DUF1801 domain-containing protein [Patescibacteria group bacterium]
MHKDIEAYNDTQEGNNREICIKLADEIQRGLPEAENKIWHKGPVWFLDGNPIVGYWVRKKGVQLLFWSGQSFDEPNLKPEGSFKAAEANYTETNQIDTKDLARWLKKSEEIQWDYKNIVKRRGLLEKLK